MKYTVCKAPIMTATRYGIVHDWFAPPEWTAPLICKEQYLQELILLQPGVYALDESRENIVAEYALKALGIHPEE